MYPGFMQHADNLSQIDIAVRSLFREYLEISACMDANADAICDIISAASVFWNPPKQELSLRRTTPSHPETVRCCERPHCTPP
jgi:hypothetical protein